MVHFFFHFLLKRNQIVETLMVAFRCSLASWEAFELSIHGSDVNKIGPIFATVYRELIHQDEINKDA